MIKTCVEFMIKTCVEFMIKTCVEFMCKFKLKPQTTLIRKPKRLKKDIIDILKIFRIPDPLNHCRFL